MAQSTIISTYLDKECNLRTMCGPFASNPLITPLITLPLQITYSCTGKPRAVVDLSAPHNSLVNSGIPRHTYLQEPFIRQIERNINKGIVAFSCVHHKVVAHHVSVLHRIIFLEVIIRDFEHKFRR